LPSLPPVHRPYRGATVARIQRRQHDQHRGSARARGYTAQWDKASKQHLQLHPLCVGCAAIGETVVATLVDHVEPHKGDLNKFWNANLWQSSCRWHHDVIKQRLEAMAERGEIGIMDLWLNSSTAIELTHAIRGHR
jgi:hypothetical protein